MGTRRRILLAVLVAATAVVAVCITDYRSEPHYQGKSLSDWVVVMRAGPDQKKGREVVHLLGPKYLPLLLEWLRQEDRPTLEGRLQNLKPDMETWLVQHKVIKPRPITSYFDAKASYNSLGLLALEELGPDGKAAIPALIQMLGDKDGKTGEMGVDAGSAYLILRGMAPESIGPLIQSLSGTNSQVRALAAGALGKIGTNANAAIPVLEVWLHDKNLGFRMEACDVLGSLGADPKVFLPVVIKSLPEADYDTLDFQLNILVRFKSDARPAIPVLLEIFSNTPASNNPTNGWIRGDIMNAMRDIDPEAAARARINLPQ
jgi:HEAT repeat protein